jgi:dGTP triphosphohydrolase
MSLLDAFKPLLNHNKEVFQSVLPNATNPPDYGTVPLERRLVHLLADKHLIAYKHACKKNASLEAVWRTHLLVDTVAGMTDGHAVKVFHMLYGVRSEGII